MFCFKILFAYRNIDLVYKVDSFSSWNPTKIIAGNYKVKSTRTQKMAKRGNGWWETVTELWKMNSLGLKGNDWVEKRWKHESPERGQQTQPQNAGRAQESSLPGISKAGRERWHWNKAKGKEQPGRQNPSLSLDSQGATLPGRIVKMMMMMTATASSPGAPGVPDTISGSSHISIHSALTSSMWHLLCLSPFYRWGT